MNKKLIVLWMLAIIIFMGLGLFGYLNQDLSEKPKQEEEEPVIENIVHTCQKEINNESSIYEFTFNNEEKIIGLKVIYKAKSSNDTQFLAANKINTNKINGIITTLEGTQNDFTFTINVDLKDYDKNELNKYIFQLSLLSITVSDVYSYDDYKSAINNIDINNGYTCD